MLVGRISGANRNLGAPPDWREDRHGRCGSLPIRDEMQAGLPAMVSAWYPTPSEITRLQGGGSVLLTVFGRAHPAVSVSVGDKPDDAAAPLPTNNGERTLVRVYRLPERRQLTKGFCFGDGTPILFTNVDWFETLVEKGRDDLERFIRGKNYFNPVDRFLVLGDASQFVFTIEPRGP